MKVLFLADYANYFSALDAKPTPFYCSILLPNGFQKCQNIAEVESCTFRPLCSCTTL